MDRRGELQLCPIVLWTRLAPATLASVLPTGKFPLLLSNSVPPLYIYDAVLLAIRIPPFLGQSLVTVVVEKKMFTYVLVCIWL